MPILKHYWTPQPNLVAHAEKLADDALTDGRGLIVELGPGASPFSRATEFVGRAQGFEPPNAYCSYHQLDLSRDELPWGDGEVDFLYTRHVLEDLDDPIWCLSEISRVAKAGYIETPSAIAELCRGVDAPLDSGPAPWRGYHHHRSLFWLDRGLLNVAAKYPVVEHLSIDNSRLESLLNRGPELWNFWCAWHNAPLTYAHHCHEVNYTIGNDYSALMQTALEASYA